MKTAYSELVEACDLTDDLPPPGERVIVIGKNYKTVGYVDDEGGWRDHFNHRKLAEFVDWYALR